MNYNIQMNCSLCNSNEISNNLTKCCKIFICLQCKDYYQQQSYCACRKSIHKPYCHHYDKLFHMVLQFNALKHSQCQRCDNPAVVSCQQCLMQFCEQCNTQIHDAVGFMKHIRQPVSQRQNATKESIDKITKKKKQQSQICGIHRAHYEQICQCGELLCQLCVKLHRQGCKLKQKNLKQYREQYYPAVIYKLKQINEYKEKLKQQHSAYKQHMQNQQKTYEEQKQILSNQFKNIIRLLELKEQQISKQYSIYWQSCRKIMAKIQWNIEDMLTQYDEYAKMLEVMALEEIPTDYIDRKIKKITINYDQFSFKVCNLDDVTSQILAVNTCWKYWQSEQHTLEDLNEKELQIMSRDSHADSEALVAISNNPTQARALILLASHNQIAFEFLHLAYQRYQYSIQYGIGIKIKGQEVFKTVKNTTGNGIISGLKALTKYRVRMRVEGGLWGDINEIQTLDYPKFNTTNLTYVKEVKENTFLITRASTLYSQNEIIFGVHLWHLNIKTQESYQNDQTACISIGVANKQNKKPIFVGTTLNYGHKVDSIDVRVRLSCEERKMVISKGAGDEVFQNLPPFPLYVCIQNKGSNKVQISYTFLDNC